MSKRIELEFERYGLSQFRKLTGLLQLLGSLGLFCGFFFPYLTSLSSLGLAFLMLLGVITRIKIKDSFLQTSPALFFFLLNLFVFITSLK